MQEYMSIQKALKSSNNLPSVAMLFDGKLFEEEIEGYRTLNVSGRETIGYNMQTGGNNNDIVLEKTVPPRTLTIQYTLEADTNEEFQQKFRYLNWLLHTSDDVPIKFRDELDITYYGQTSNMGAVPPESNSVVSTFEIYCSDPYKYDDDRVLTGNPLTVLLSSPYDVKPDEIEIVMNKAADKITVDNITTGRHIILNGDYKTGDVINIQIPENEITQNNQNIMSELGFTESDFHRFTITE